jgi:hypothetical protein
VGEDETFGVDLTSGEPVEHERVIGVGAVRQGDRSHARILVARLTSHSDEQENGANSKHTKQK